MFDMWLVYAKSDFQAISENQYDISCLNKEVRETPDADVVQRFISFSLTMLSF